MRRFIFIITLLWVSISATANGSDYFQHVRALYNQGKYEEALLGFENCKTLYNDELDSSTINEWIGLCNKKIEEKGIAERAALERKARADAAVRRALQARRDKGLVYISSDALNLDGASFDLSSIVINSVQNKTNLLFTSNPDDAFYYVYVSAIARKHNQSGGGFYSNVVVSVRIKDLDGIIHFANRFEDTEGHSLSFEKATELCYSKLGETIGSHISNRLAGTPIASLGTNKKSIAVVVSSNTITVSDLDFVELHFRNAFNKLGYQVKKPSSGAIDQLRRKAIAYQEAGNVSSSESKHLTEQTGADLLCVVVINHNESFGTYNFSSSTIDLSSGLIIGSEAFYSLPKDRKIDDQNAVLAAVGNLIRDMELTSDSSIRNGINIMISQANDAYQRDSTKTAIAATGVWSGNERDYKKAIGYAFVPGLAQIKDHEDPKAKGLGITFISAETVFIGGIIVSQYMRSLNATKINSTHNSSEKAHYANMANTWNIVTYVSAAGAVGFYIWNVLDGISRAKNKNLAFIPYSSPEYTGVMLTLNF